MGFAEAEKKHASNTKRLDKIIANIEAFERTCADPELAAHLRTARDRLLLAYNQMRAKD